MKCAGGFYRSTEFPIITGPSATAHVSGESVTEVTESRRLSWTLSVVLNTRKHHGQQSEGSAFNNRTKTIELKRVQPEKQLWKRNTSIARATIHCYLCIQFRFLSHHRAVCAYVSYSFERDLTCSSFSFSLSPSLWAFGMVIEKREFSIIFFILIKMWISWIIWLNIAIS